ncbi:hypothetical protein KSC_072650 [Ktedonobacter sp. SOSP1-52]|nr:hypothetical protein KSC_072650 [Ktedonobacter sp. SOSP1-52]
MAVGLRKIYTWFAISLFSLLYLATICYQLDVFPDAVGGMAFSLPAAAKRPLLLTDMLNSQHTVLLFWR